VSVLLKRVGCGCVWFVVPALDLICVRACNGTNGSDAHSLVFICFLKNHHKKNTQKTKTKRSGGARREFGYGVCYVSVSMAVDFDSGSSEDQV
jgi:hypothetical protein